MRKSSPDKRLPQSFVMMMMIKVMIEKDDTSLMICNDDIVVMMMWRRRRRMWGLRDTLHFTWSEEAYLCLCLNDNWLIPSNDVSFSRERLSCQGISTARLSENYNYSDTNSLVDSWVVLLILYCRFERCARINLKTFRARKKDLLLLKCILDEIFSWLSCWFSYCTPSAFTTWRTDKRRQVPSLNCRLTTNRSGFNWIPVVTILSYLESRILQGKLGRNQDVDKSISSPSSHLLLHPQEIKMRMTKSGKYQGIRHTHHLTKESVVSLLMR